METTHTPGPWFAVDYAGSICIQNGPMYEDADLLSYDCICGDTPVRYKDEVEANAKLMAAAPELIEALSEMIRMYEEVQPAGGWQGVYEYAKYALEKATE